MQKTFESENSIIHYTDIGDGTPVILIHGFGEDSTIWKIQKEYLASYCRLIVPDLPGSGSSQIKKTSSCGFDEIENYSDCINSLLEALKIDHCVMLGHSMGGYITLAFAEKYPGRLLSFGLVHSTAFADSIEKKETRRKGINAIKQYGAFAFLKTTIPNLFSNGYKKMHHQEVQSLIEHNSYFTETVLVNYYTAMMNRPDRTAVLKQTDKPVLFVIGTEDVAAPMSDVVQQAHFPEVSYIRVLQDCGHMGMWEQPGVMNQTLKDFVISF